MLCLNPQDVSKVNSKIRQSKPDVPSIRKACSYLKHPENSRERDHEQCNVWNHNFQIFSHEITTEKRQGNSLCGHPTNNPNSSSGDFIFLLQQVKCSTRLGGQSGLGTQKRQIDHSLRPFIHPSTNSGVEYSSMPHIALPGSATIHLGSTNLHMFL